ncbi:hypothetical protein BH24GEM2_BH24GEM2_16040 [soil metagenome]
MLSHRFFVSLLAIALASGRVADAQQTRLPATPSSVDEATLADHLRRWVGLLADDSLRGRQTGTPTERAAAAYIAREAMRLGLQPAGDSCSFYHRVPLEMKRWEWTARATTTSSGAVRFTPGEVFPTPWANFTPNSRTQAQGPLVYAGYVNDPGVPPAQRLTPKQMAGAVIILRGAHPPGSTSERELPPFLTLDYTRPQSRTAAAILLVAEGRAAAYAQEWHQITEHGRLGAPEWKKPFDHAPIFWITPEVAEQLLGQPLASARMPRTGLGTFSYTLRRVATPIEGQNVVAVFPGRDPARRGEYVALGAHYDGIGVRSPMAGDSIYNGADDNASGVVALLEVAKRFTALPIEQRPARSLLFVWHTAEEGGLHGSAHFTARPTVPLKSIVAYLNLDMVGRNHPDSLHVVGPRRLSTQLGEAVEAVNHRQARPFVLDYTLDAPKHAEGVFCRSDHLNYAKHGIPVVFFTTGQHPDYHRPSDEAGKLNYAKLARITVLAGDLAAELANRPARPVVDKPVRQYPEGCQQ